MIDSAEIKAQKNSPHRVMGAVFQVGWFRQGVGFFLISVPVGLTRNEVVVPDFFA